MDRFFSEMKWQILFLKEGHPAFNGLTSEQKQFLMPPTRDDFFVSASMFAGPEDEVHKQISSIEKDGHAYFSLNELIAGGSFTESNQKIAENLREYLRGSYEKVKT